VPSSDPLQRFQDILDNIARIERFTAGLNLQTFRENEQVLFAVEHALLIISEGAAKLGALAVELCPDIPWTDIRETGFVTSTTPSLAVELPESGRSRSDAKA